MMPRKRTYILLIMATMLAGIGLVLSTGDILTERWYQDSYVAANGIHAELLPAESHITGRIQAEHPFSVYIVRSESGYFEGVNGHNVVMSWENVTSVSLDFNTSNGTHYLVVKNGNVSQVIKIIISADH